MRVGIQQNSKGSKPVTYSSSGHKVNVVSARGRGKGNKVAGWEEAGMFTQPSEEHPVKFKDCSHTRTTYRGFYIGTHCEDCGAFADDGV